MPKVVALRRYPLKSARAEILPEVDVEPAGLRGDRVWACVDGQDATIGSAKHPRRWGRLLDVGATLRDGDPEPTLTLRVDGHEVRAGTAEAETVLGHHLGRPVRLIREVPSDPRLHRTLPQDAGLVPQWMDDVPPGQDTVTALAGAQPGGRFVDFGAVHLVTTGALSTLGARTGGAGAVAARFRPNLVLDAPGDPEPGQELRLGDVLLRVVVPTPRCVVPGLAQADVPADRGVLSALARHYRVPVAGLGQAACFGVYAEVVEPGRLRTGQHVH
ncbi:MOSC domain-containing protein [Verrucosispora sp. SN26_14.1]|uniref:MOSC domain-containing protein n=1 Tax=Verrucosispora sp. SN26_14.1 TaxID=2527879 RepID=UPI001034292F|nr:MOSC domain-containing protein [Verrucosispora sp. SN26_14.1]TBL42717.1 MOSC domain-containing protein [Verrucosispora sp. SN26_14.1]